MRKATMNSNCDYRWIVNVYVIPDLGTSILLYRKKKLLLVNIYEMYVYINKRKEKYVFNKKI